jgi:ribosome-associated protein
LRGLTVASAPAAGDAAFHLRVGSLQRRRKFFSRVLNLSRVSSILVLWWFATPDTERVLPLLHTATAHHAPETPLASKATMAEVLIDALEDAKAEDIVTLDLTGKTAIADAMIVATGRSNRHVGAIADQVTEKLKASGFRNLQVEGLELCDWVLIDAGDVIVHVFRPEVRAFYNLEKMWTGDRPALAAAE